MQRCNSSGLFGFKNQSDKPRGLGQSPNYAVAKTSLNKIFSWLTTKSQLSYLLVHFLDTLSVAKYSIFIKLSSFGNINFVLVTFLNWLFKLSIQFVVYII